MAIKNNRMEKNYYMVRAMGSTDAELNVFIDNSVVAVGWSDINFSNYNIEKSDELVNAVRESYYAAKGLWQPTISKKLNEVRRFHEIKKGDYIVIPYGSAIRLAKAEETKKYDVSSKGLDLSNQREVTYLGSSKAISRDFLSEELQRRLRVRGSTVSNLYEFKDEIEELFNDKDNYSWSNKFIKKEMEQKEKLKVKLINNIVIGKTNLKAGGLGLEQLVQELLECEGYSAKILPKTSFKGTADADILGFKPDPFQDINVLVQVKHHIGYTDDWGLKQLAAIKNLPEYGDHTFVLVTSANIQEKTRKIADDLQIITKDGNELADWIIDNIHKLNSDTRKKLGICSIPQILD